MRLCIQHSTVTTLQAPMLKKDIPSMLECLIATISKGIQGNGHRSARTLHQKKFIVKNDSGYDRSNVKRSFANEN